MVRDDHERHVDEMRERVNKCETSTDERVAISILNAYKEGYKSAIEDYKQEPCDDAISREDALMCLTGMFKLPLNYNPEDLIALFSKRIKALPSVTQKSGNPQPSEHFIDGVHAMGYREGYKDAQKQKSGK